MSLYFYIYIDDWYCINRVFVPVQIKTQKRGKEEGIWAKNLCVTYRACVKIGAIALKTVAKRLNFAR